MSDASVALLACPPDPNEPQAAFGWLPKVVPGVLQFVSATAKVQPPAGVKKLKIATDYTAELARIESLASIARGRHHGLSAVADSVAIFALRRLLELRPNTVRVALLREKMVADPAALEPAFAKQDRPLAPFVEDPAVILFDRSQYGANLMFSLVLDSVLSGAIYAVGETSLLTLFEEAQKIALSAPMRELAATGHTVSSGVEVY